MYLWFLQGNSDRHHKDILSSGIDWKCRWKAEKVGGKGIENTDRGCIHQNFIVSKFNHDAPDYRDRTDYCKKGCKSKPTTVTSGLPQGSVLGPALFSIFINDFVNSVKCCGIRLFADDTMLYTEVTKPGEA